MTSLGTKKPPSYPRAVKGEYGARSEVVAARKLLHRTFSGQKGFLLPTNARLVIVLPLADLRQYAGALAELFETP